MSTWRKPAGRKEDIEKSITIITVTIIIIFSRSVLNSRGLLLFKKVKN